MSKMLYILSGLIVILICSGCVFVKMGMATSQINSYSQGRVTIEVESGKATGIGIQANKNKTKKIDSEIYVKFRSGEIRDVRLITPSFLSEKYGRPVKQTSFHHGNELITYSNGAFARFVFTKGELIDVSIGSDAGDLAPLLGVKREGPFYELPFSKKQMKELFGEPESKKDFHRL